MPPARYANAPISLISLSYNLNYGRADRSTSPAISLAAQVIQTPSRQPTGKRNPDGNVSINAGNLGGCQKSKNLV